MIKLIATDVDWTLVPEGTMDLNPEYFRVFEELYKSGIQICICSGRQLTSMKRTFKYVPYVNYVAGNGSNIEGIDYKKVFTFEEDEYLELMGELLKLPKDYHFMVDVGEVSYFEERSGFFYHKMKDGYGCDCVFSEDLMSLKNVSKVALFNSNGIEKKVEEYLLERFGNGKEATLAGPLFFDIMKKGCNKGKAVEEFQKFYNISKDETMAFGDSNNDISMLSAATHSYAMENATDKLKSVAKYVIGPMEEDSVLKKIIEVMDL